MRPINGAHSIIYSKDQGWGVLTDLVLPGGGKFGLYQPRHARPVW